MKRFRKVFVLTLVLAMVFNLSLVNAQVYSVERDEMITERIIEHELAPINKEAYIDKFIKEGLLPANPTQEEISAVFEAVFGGRKIQTKQTKSDKVRAAKFVKEMKAAKDKNVNADKLNNSVSKSRKLDPITENTESDVIKEIKVLALLIEFNDMKHNEIVPDSERSYHTEDFSREHYQNLLFGETEYTTPEGVTSPTMTTYYDQQSNGHLRITGDVYGWYSAEHDAAYYGQNATFINEDGEEEEDPGADAAPKDLVVEAINAAVAAGVDLSEYDLYNNETFEPGADGIIDHLMILHAGLGEEEGGGSIEGDAIWSHSWDLYEEHYADIDGDIYATNYTIEPENGAIGVMVHEFAHDLGIPDDYDTGYTGDGDIVEAWSLMAGGSWTGEVGGTEPVGINPWGRLYLAFYHTGLANPWQNFAWIDLGDFEGELSLDTASYKTNGLQSLIVELPAKVKTLFTPIEGEQTFWGGDETLAFNTLDYAFTLPTDNNASLSYDIWYDIEKDWDAGFVQISTDGVNFTSLETPMTTTFENADGHPDVMNNLPGYTGSSNGWQSEAIDLSSYSGDLTLRFAYATDWGTENPGMFIDSISLVDGDTIILQDGAENGLDNFNNVGWEQNSGASTSTHRYIMEWRSHLNADQGLTAVGGANFDYNQGLLIWYGNDAYEDNAVGVHPGYGRLGVVDAEQFVYLNQGLGNGNEYGSFAGYMPFIQLKDAAFSTDKVEATDLSYYSWASGPLPGMNSNPLFNDHNNYFTFKSPYSGLKLSEYGLQVKVLGEADDYSQGLIEVKVANKQNKKEK